MGVGWSEEETVGDYPTSDTRPCNHEGSQAMGTGAQKKGAVEGVSAREEPSMRVFLHVRTRAPKPEIVLYSFVIKPSALILPDNIRDSIRACEGEVKCVELGNNPAMSCESLGGIVESLMSYKIEALDLSSNPQLGDHLVAKIQPLLEAQKAPLTDLKLANCGLTVAGLEWLVNVAKKSSLRVLDISCIQIRHESRLIEQVLELPMIEELALCCCDLSPEEIRIIAEGLPFTSIKSLNLAGNDFGSEGLVHLACKLSESFVEDLDLSGVGIEYDCQGMTELAKAWAKRPFAKLCLNHNLMTQQGIWHFTNTLRTLVTEDCSLALVDALWAVNNNASCC